MAYLIEWPEVIDPLREINCLFLLPAILVLLLTLVVRAIRWHYLLRPIKLATLYNLFAATTIGFMANMLLPARVGELIRAYILGQREQISKTAALASVFLERLWDVIILLSFLALLVITRSIRREILVDQRLLGIGYISLGLIGLIFLSLILIRHKAQPISDRVATMIAPFSRQLAERIRGIINSFTQGLVTLRMDRNLVNIIFWSLTLWITAGLSLHLILFAFDLHLPLPVPFFLLILQAFGVALPSSPGFIGTYHAATVAGLTMLGIPRGQALSVAIVMHASFFIPMVLLGLGLLWMEGISWKQLRDISSS